MFKCIQSGKNINTVFSLWERFIVKKYLSREKRQREFSGIKSWKKALNSPVIPRVYFQLGPIVCFKKINGTPNPRKKSRQFYLKTLANLYQQLIDNFSYHQESGSKDYQRWNQYLDRVSLYFTTYQSQLEKHLTQDEYYLLEATANELKLVDWECYAKIPLHRDLHWGNILEESGQCKVIDFEHSCNGPIEFEFCNSLFWNDQLSIDFRQICKLLQNKGVEVNKMLSYKLTLLYFLDQFHLALDGSDQGKLNLVLKNFKKFLRRNRNLLCRNFNEETLSKIQDVHNQEVLIRLPLIFTPIPSALV